MYRGRGPLRGQWYELWLAAGAIASAAAASVALRLIHQAGGFAVRPPSAAFAYIDTLYSNVWVAVESVLLLFGADFSGQQMGSPRRHRAGAPGRGGAGRMGGRTRLAAIRGRGASRASPGGGGGRAAYGLRDQGDPQRGRRHPRDRGSTANRGGPRGQVPGRPAHPAAGTPRRWRWYWAATSGSWLTTPSSRPGSMPTGRSLPGCSANHLSYGLADYWNANAMTVDSGNRVQVRPISNWPGTSSCTAPGSHRIPGTTPRGTRPASSCSLVGPVDAQSAPSLGGRPPRGRCSARRPGPTG